MMAMEPTQLDWERGHRKGLAVRTKREWWLFWTNEHALRIEGRRMGPNRVRRLRKQSRHTKRVIQGRISNSSWAGMI